MYEWKIKVTRVPKKRTEQNWIDFKALESVENEIISRKLSASLFQENVYIQLFNITFRLFIDSHDESFLRVFLLSSTAKMSSPNSKRYKKMFSSFACYTQKKILAKGWDTPLTTFSWNPGCWQTNWNVNFVIFIFVHSSMTNQDFLRFLCQLSGAKWISFLWNY